MHLKQRGFTMIEILMAMLIGSILLLVAIPLYQDYKTKTKVSTALQSASSLKSNVTQHFYMNGEIPTNNAQALSNEKTYYKNQWVESIEITDTPSAGSIIITFNKNALPALGDENLLILQPSLVGGKMRWQCLGNQIPEDFRPQQCN